VRRSLARIRHRRRDLPVVPARPVEGAAPEVTVVIATYNRPNVLRYAIESVLAQTVRDWELIVIGDACTDDTAEVVAGYRDPRISFVNLERNIGDQSGPNSVGAGVARGRYLAWLNHDDLWFPDHLETTLAIAREGADLVLAPFYRVDRVAAGAAGQLAGRVTATTLPASFRLVEGADFPASSWLISTRLVRRLGAWRSGRSTRYSTSQELLYRAWSAGARIVSSSRRTLVIIPSIVVDNAYATRRDDEQRILGAVVGSSDRGALERLVAPATTRPFLISQAIAVPARERGRARTWLFDHADAIHRQTTPLAVRLGIAPWEYAGVLLGLPPGGTLAILRHLRGLPK
jgi:hypothetical protein